MVAYHQFVELSQSTDSEARGQAAHLAALAYLAHSGPADEQAALYAALVSFLDDPSVKVRAALAYGLLHTIAAPRPIILALLHDSGIIARAVAQYCPALLDTDLLAFIRDAEPALLMAVAMRDSLSARVAEALLDRRDRDVALKLLRRPDGVLSPASLLRLAEEIGRLDADMRGALLARPDLPAAARLLLVEAVADALKGIRLVKGAIQPKRLGQAAARPDRHRADRHRRACRRRAPRGLCREADRGRADFDPRHAARDRQRSRDVLCRLHCRT